MCVDLHRHRVQKAIGSVNRHLMETAEERRQRYNKSVKLSELVWSCLAGDLCTWIQDVWRSTPCKSIGKLAEDSSVITGRSKVVHRVNALIFDPEEYVVPQKQMPEMSDRWTCANDTSNGELVTFESVSHISQQEVRPGTCKDRTATALPSVTTDVWRTTQTTAGHHSNQIYIIYLVQYFNRNKGPQLNIVIIQKL